MRSYKANNKNELYYIFAYVAILIVGVALTKKPMTALYAGGVFIPLAVIYILFYIRLTEIQVDKKKGKLAVINSSHLYRKKELVYDIANLEWGYKRGDVVKADEKKSVFILYNAGNEVLKLKDDKDGWKSDTMYDLVVHLEKLGVKRKFTGYMMKDAEV
jgi:hypothetical protein